jgi:hypothetical protein
MTTPKPSFASPVSTSINRLEDLNKRYLHLLQSFKRNNAIHLRFPNLSKRGSVKVLFIAQPSWLPKGQAGLTPNFPEHYLVRFISHSDEDNLEEVIEEVRGDKDPDFLVAVNFGEYVLPMSPSEY